MPTRIKRKRIKGWRMPVDAVYVGRPTKFGNPFNWRENGRENAVEDFRAWVGPWGANLFPSLEDRRAVLLAHLAELRGKDLACWCSFDEPCHADVLLELANP
jgi:hypothetical protein